jgi:hypothetical protein
MNPFFHALGTRAVHSWQALNFDPRAFPALAARLLEEADPARNADLERVLEDFLLTEEQPFQTQSGFGQPELVVFDHPRLYIQLLFWMDGTTDIHQHEFDGAFHVLQGSSLHSTFRFLDPKPVSAHLRTGTLKRLRSELLPTGATVPIRAGTEFIHALFHLETPSVTVVLRTHTSPGTGPQFTYLPPHIALDPFHHDSLTQRRKQLLDVLDASGHPSFPKLVFEMLDVLDFERGFFILQNCVSALRSRGLWNNATKVFKKRHAARAKAVFPTLDEIVQRDLLAGLRGAVDEPEHRFFLALLLNLDSRRDLYRLVGQRFSGKPGATIARWMEEIWETVPEAVPPMEARLEQLGAAGTGGG